LFYQFVAALIDLMNTSGDSQVSGPYGALYRATVTEAAAGGHPLMGKLVNAVKHSLGERDSAVRDFREREQLAESRRLLEVHAEALCNQYPASLLAAFSEMASADKVVVVASGAVTEVRFDQLELMDEGQVNESVEMARSQQVAMLAADAALADLNTLICATLGLKTVRPERNPLRPEVYVKALQTVMTGLHVPTPIRLDWMRYMCAALGTELRAFYVGLSSQLRTQGVVAARYAVLQTPGGGVVGGGGGVSPSARADVTPALEPRAAHVLGTAASGTQPPAGQGTHNGRRAVSRRTPQPRVQDEAFLTLDKLRRLLAGELDGQQVVRPAESFAERFSREFESAPHTLDASDGPDTNTAPPSDFHPTVPAAFEALTEMKQVDQVMQRIENRQGLTYGDNASGAVPHDAVRRLLRHEANGLGQALSLEVVMLMVDNIARDPRLLEPIAQVVRSLEPSLLRLALVDPRFFSDKQHPARRLLQEITHRSLAYESVDAKGFAGFLDPLQQAVQPLSGIQIDSAEPFDMVLNGLVDIWDARSRHEKQQIEKAVDALRNAEARNLLADTIATDIRARPDAALVVPEVIEFLCGPWSQVVAQAKISDQTHAKDPGQFVELIAVLMWSAQPELTRKNVSELTRLVPKLLTKLREGLDTIHYPSVKTSAFFEVLMNLHQQAFRPATKEPAAVVDGSKSQNATVPPLSRPGDADPWIAPMEAKASGFMEMPLDAPARLSASDASQGDGASVMGAEPQLPPSDAALPIGAWVELLVNGRWTRTQLTWASPHGTLFLFTSAFGTTQSMTRRSRDKLFTQGIMRVISGLPVVDGALDAVAHTAMLNSMDSIPHDLPTP
jgi:hypothetical protein